MRGSRHLLPALLTCTLPLLAVAQGIAVPDTIAQDTVAQPAAEANTPADRVLAERPLAKPTRANPARYALDPVHTRVMFAVSHAGFSQAIGTVSGSTGELWFDPQDWTGARLQAHVPIAKIDLGDAKWNKAALANNLLDADDHPQASFVSTRIEPVDAQRARVFGNLTLHGVTREVKMDVVLNAAKRHPMPPFRRTVGFSATATISRKDFGIDAWPSVIGDTVELRIEAEATHARGGERQPPATTSPASPVTQSGNAGKPATDAADPGLPAMPSATGTEIEPESEAQTEMEREPTPEPEPTP